MANQKTKEGLIISVIKKVHQLSLASLVMVFLLAVNNTPFPFVVISGFSMEPALSIGSLAFIEGIQPHEIRVGDIIAFESTFSPQAGIIVHRVIEIQQSPDGIWVRTKGDANPDPDPAPTHYLNIFGRVWFVVPYVGILWLVLRVQEVQIAIILLLLAGIIVTIIRLKK